MKRVFGFVRRRKGKSNQPLSSEADKTSMSLSSPLGNDGFLNYFEADESPSPYRTSQYHYAVNEYLQTLQPLEGNNDGRIYKIGNGGQCQSNEFEEQENENPVLEETPQFEVVANRQQIPTQQVTSSNTGTNFGDIASLSKQEVSIPAQNGKGNADDVEIFYSNNAQYPSTSYISASQSHDSNSVVTGLPPRGNKGNSPVSTFNSGAKGSSDCYYFDGGDGKYQRKQQWEPINEPNMPDATYEETYGDCYIGGPIRYIYPSGYHNLRPRSGPWKLSLLVFMTFSWLSVFIVGYCADMVDLSVYENRGDDANGSNVDDDGFIFETRWCGSRILYFMWVVSISITGLAASYCSIIGYVQVRDFVVANCRSQPPGMVGKSDYYVRIEDLKKMPMQPPRALGKLKSYQSGRDITIYQADGTPQFWGDYIYRPTQAAVAVTSR